MEKWGQDSVCGIFKPIEAGSKSSEECIVDKDINLTLFKGMVQGRCDLYRVGLRF